jgi:F-type H+-transporting ATPase subunit b
VPQLNPNDFLPQLVWLAITFVILYVAMARLALPKIAAVLAKRDRQIEEDLTRAERLKADADKALAAYEAALTEARASAQALLRDTGARLSAAGAERERSVVKTLTERTREAEERIAAAKRGALADLPTAVAEVAAKALEKLIGEAPPAEEVRRAVAATLGGSRNAR